MFPQFKKPLNANQSSHNSEWKVGPDDSLNSVVFVHGILGHRSDTWGSFPELIDSDPELPRMDILCWGYPSGLVPGSYQDIETEADALLTGLGHQMTEGRDIYLVAHSMGGLVCLRGIVKAAQKGRGKDFPTNAIRMIVLYATPLQGSAVADTVAIGITTISRLHWLVRLVFRFLPVKQLRDLRRGDFVQQLVSDTVEYVYRPRPDSQFVERSIPVQACTGTQDSFVTKTSAIGVFQEPAPAHLHGTHSTVKQPEDHNDIRYLVFKNNLIEDLKRSFVELCRNIMNGDNETDRRRHLDCFDRQYGHMVETCAKACSPDPDRLISDHDKFLIGVDIMKFGCVEGTTPQEAVRSVILDFTLPELP